MAKMILRIGKISFGALGVIVIVGLVIYSARFLTFAEDPVIEQEVAELTASARAYQANEQYAEAEQIYMDIIRQYPGTDYALNAQKDLAFVYIQAGNDSAAGQAIDTLKNDYTGHPELFTNIYEFAKYYRRRGKLDKARELYQYVFENCPDSDLAAKSLRWVASCEIESGNYSAAEQAIDTLKNDYAGHPELGWLYKLGDEYRRQKKYEEAKQLYQYILDNYPDSEYLIWAKAGIIQSDIALGNDPNITEELDGLIADFVDNPGLPEALCIIGEDYGVKASELKKKGLETEADEYFRKAVSVWERVIHEFPNSDLVPRAYYCSAGCYGHELAEYEKAIEYYQKILDNWPYFDYRRASYAQFGITRCYQNLEKSGRISPEEAATGIIQACNNLLANYPETNPAILQAARKLLDKYKVSK